MTQAVLALAPLFVDLAQPRLLFLRGKHTACVGRLLRVVLVDLSRIFAEFEQRELWTSALAEP